MRGGGTLSDYGMALLAQGKFRIFLRGGGTLSARGVRRSGHPRRLGAEEVEDEEAPGRELGDEDPCTSVVAVAMEGEAAACEDDMVEVAAAVGIGGLRGRLEEDFGVVYASVGDDPADVFAEEPGRSGWSWTIQGEQRPRRRWRSIGPSSSISASERRRPRERWKSKRYFLNSEGLVIILAVLKIDLKVEAQTNWREGDFGGESGGGKQGRQKPSA